MPRKQNPDPLSAQQQQELVSEGLENFELPKSVVMKIAKAAIPEEARLTKETVLSLVKGSTVFINYLAATAHDVASAKQHKSIAASDVLRALELMDFGDLVEPLQAELEAYKDQGKTTVVRKATNGTTGSKGFSISIPPGGGSASGVRVLNPQKIKLTVPGQGNGVSGKGKGKAATAVTAIDVDGDAQMRGADEEVLGGDIEDRDMIDDGGDEDETQDVDEDEDDSDDGEMDPPDSPSVAGASEGAHPSYS